MKGIEYKPSTGQGKMIHFNNADMELSPSLNRFYEGWSNITNNPLGRGFASTAVTREPFPEKLRVVVDFNDIFTYFYYYLASVRIPDPRIAPGETLEERLLSVQPIDLIQMAMDALSGILVYARERMTEFHDVFYKRLAELEHICCRLDKEPSNYEGLYPNGQPQPPQRQLLLDLMEEQITYTIDSFFDSVSREGTQPPTEDLLWKVLIATIIRISQAVNCLALDMRIPETSIVDYDLEDPEPAGRSDIYTYVLNLSPPSIYPLQPGVTP